MKKKPLTEKEKIRKIASKVSKVIRKEGERSLSNFYEKRGKSSIIDIKDWKKHGFFLVHIHEKWDLRFLDLAYYIGSRWSKDPSTKVGAVITDKKNRIISMGFNGFPRNVKDEPSRLKNRAEKYKFVVHAEANAILFAKQDLEGTVLYTWPFPPCADCAGLIIQSGIKKVVSQMPTKAQLKRWKDSFEIADKMFFEAGIYQYLYPRIP